MDADEYEQAREQIARERKATGQRRYREVMVSDAPPPMSPYLDKGVVDSVFGELWNRGGITRKERRFITLACVGAAGVDVPVDQHVYAALASGDLTREEFQEFVLHFAYYAGWPRASLFEKAFHAAVARLDQETEERR